MGLLDKLTSGVSDAYDSAQEAVSSAIDDTKEAVSGAASTLASAASDAYDSAKETASGVVDAAGGAMDTAKAEVENASAWVKHQADGFASDLEAKLNPGAAAAKEQEGKVADAARSPATLPADQPVDLNSPTDRARFLAQWGQFDKTDATESDGSRCQSNTAMAGLLLNGGPERLQKGLLAAQKEAESVAASETDPDRKKMLQGAAKQLGETAAAAGKNKLTPDQMDKASDALFKTFADNDHVDVKTGSEKGKGMDAKGVAKLEKTLGLNEDPDSKWSEVKERSWIDPRGWGSDDNEEVNDQIWGGMKPGQQAHISVKGENTYAAQGKGPNGEKIELTSKGVPYYNEKGTGERKWLSGGTANHAVLFGRNENGARYIYNPGASPSYIHEDPKNPKEFDKHAATLVAKRNKDDFYANVTPYS